MIKEINKAVETFHRIAFGTKHNILKVPDCKLATFVSALTDLLTARYEKNWYPENPARGSGYRCIRVNSQCIDPTIVESLKRANIEITRGLIITELTIWVDPGVVSVRIGEDGSIGSEVIDGEVYMNGRNTHDVALERCGFDSDDGLSSRSSTPESNQSDISRSSTPLSSKYSASSSPPAMEFNHYSAPVISYQSLYQRPVTPLTLQSQVVPPATASHLQPQLVRSQGRPVLPFNTSMVTMPNRDHFSQPNYIPTSHPAASTHSPAVFANLDSFGSSGSSQNEYRKTAFNPYLAMPMMYGGSLQQTFYDIPAVA